VVGADGTLLKVAPAGASAA